MRKFKYYQRKFAIKDIRPEDRPLQRLIKNGPQVLSNSELLAILLWKVPKDSVLNKVNEIFKRYNLKTLSYASIEELNRILRNKIKACQIAASFELARRLASYTDEERPLIEEASDIFRILGPEMQALKQECVKVVLLDSRNRLIKCEEISKGSLDVNIIHPRDVFRKAIENNAASIILVHNHPSGDPEPSKEDLKITKQICKAGEILGIKVEDHIIIGSNGFVSLKKLIS